MRTSDKGILALLTHEGIVPGPYFDSQKVLTYGVGHTKAAGYPDPANMPGGMPGNLDAELMRIFQVFRKDLEKYEAEVRKAIKVDVTQAQFDAAVSFHINTGGIGRAQWVKLLNKGDVIGAGAAIMNWKRPDEIIPRRRAEQKLFRSGVYPTTRIVVWNVSRDRLVIWEPVKHLGPQQALGLLRGPFAHDDAQGAPAGGISPVAAILAAVTAAIAGITAKWAEITAWLSQIFGG